MATKMIMPKVDMDQETGTVVEWLKGEGQRVEAGETILVIETDKIAIDVEAPGSGILDGISAHPGDVIPIGSVIAYILEEGEELPELATRTTMDKDVPAFSPSLLPDSKEIPATPVARKLAAARGVDLSTIRPTGKGGKITKGDVEEALAQAASSGTEGKILAAPAVRRIARLEGIDLSLIKGSGPKGRVQIEDLEGYQSQEGIPMAAVLGGDIIPVTGIRRTISERLTRSWGTIPHIQFSARADMTVFNKTRDEYNKSAQKRGKDKLSVTGLLVYLVAKVLVDHPWLNSSFIDDTIILHKDINIGVAVALEKGLIVPVVKTADQKNIAQVSAETNQLIQRARAGKLTSPDVKGGTFTISNLGPFGIEQFSAIINPPEAGILAVGATRSEAVVMSDGVIAARPIMRFTLSADHRIIDGAVAARFIADLITTLENPLIRE
jgi:pyruvate dehydrogenase E2 component (dihydrolipoamide acetyltransferase)